MLWNALSVEEKKNPKIQITPEILASKFPGRTVIGVDEVGRGCLAGPVFAGACVLKSEACLEVLTDSKLISEKRRDDIALEIQTHHWVETAFATVEEIDELNILWASQLAMVRAIQSLCEKYLIKDPVVLVDGNQVIRDFGDEVEQYALIKGDLRCPAISAGAIVAKVTRDNLMREFADKHREYGFAGHKGYATKAHKEAIEKFGPLPIHRRSFAGVKEFLSAGH